MIAIKRAVEGGHRHIAGGRQHAIAGRAQKRDQRAHRDEGAKDLGADGIFGQRHVAGSGPRGARLFDRNSGPGSVYGRLRIRIGVTNGRVGSRYFTCTTSFILGWMWQRTSKVPASRKGFGKILARGLFVGIEQARDINLMDEFVLVGEGQRLAPIDGDLAGMKGAALLRDGVGSSAKAGAASPSRIAAKMRFMPVSPACAHLRAREVEEG